MNRLGIFSFHDPEGIVDSYVEYLLEELMTVLDKLMIVVNGNLEDNSRMVLERYTTDLLLRENVGYDGGAYADVIVNVLGEDVKEWDEVVLCNDTFFGPFVPMKTIFSKMENIEADFWGLNQVDEVLYFYIQSYFLVFRKEIIKNGDLLEFFRTNIDPYEVDRKYLFGTFELGITHYLKEKQYMPGSFTNTNLCQIFYCPNICMREFNLPILKKKSFSSHFFDAQEIDSALCYLQDHTNYDIRLVLQCVKRLYDFEQTSEYGCSKNTALVQKPVIFYPKYSCSEAEMITRLNNRPFYLYGTGGLSYAIFLLFLHRQPNFQGFVVSDSQEIETPTIRGFPVFYYREIPKDALLVLGVRKQTAEEIKSYIYKSHEIIELWE